MSSGPMGLALAFGRIAPLKDAALIFGAAPIAGTWHDPILRGDPRDVMLSPRLSRACKVG
jgi:hypothetical protein